ncbi:sulfotransferase domain-containing protein [Brevundimonas sp.]|uniref:sulfotransferase domain-containing protein n=1 Tax=Brevundimonas sp. TaxID=1871086 RepID=UPI0025FD4371|nr:sulfotransferase domain-containing protein [Brevundimonas sp.]
MFIIANGAYKGGSTWLYQIAECLPGFSPVPPEFRDPKFQNASLDLEKFDRLMQVTGNFYSKQHWYGAQIYKDILSHDRVRMLNIVRNIGDVVVSFYFHLRRGNHFDGPFDEYFASSGLRHVVRYIDYQTWWHQPGVREPYMLSYEGLKSNFDESAIALLSYLDITPSSELVALLETTDVLHSENGRIVGEGKFFRKAVVGDYENFLTSEMKSKINDLCRARNYDSLVRGLRARFPHCEATLSAWDFDA